MLEIISITEKQDKNGKQFKTYLLEDTHKARKGKRANHVIYDVDYSNNVNPLRELDEGDSLDGELVTMKVKPRLLGDEIITSATLCLLEELLDPIDRELAIEKLFSGNGYRIEPGQLRFGEAEYEFEKVQLIPDNCLII